MTETAEAERRYREDLAFRALADAIARHAHSESYTRHEIMLAAAAAVLLIEQWSHRKPE
ncbi:MAG TPA: hypothetical protein VFQ61_06570 [Polyangiaceae bacterium]|nr:hypothetical protein [Polyangiaceae bacterium]